jgi:predicted permease
MLKAALRSLAKSPVFTTVTILSLALALALNTTLFSVVDAVLHPVNPYSNPTPVASVMIVGGDKRHVVPRRQLAVAIRGGLGSAKRFTEWTSGLTLIDGGTSSVDARAAAVPADFFDVVGVKPEVGRTFSTGDPSRRMHEAVISYGTWNRLFAAKPLGDLRITVAGVTYSVVGVLPPAAQFPWNSEAWVPAEAALADSMTWRFGPFVTFEMKPGVTQAQVERELDAVAQSVAAAYGQNIPYVLKLSTLGAMSARISGYGFMLQIVALVLIIACANLGTMMLARGMARRRELALRMALGASRRHIIALVMTECGVLVAAGVAASLVLLLWALHILPHLLIPHVPMLGDLRPTLSWRVFAFAVIAATATTLLAGVLPALRAAGTDPAEPLKEGGSTSERIRDRYNPLIVTEVALSTALLMSSGLFVIMSIQHAGFRFNYDASRLITADIGVPPLVTKQGATPDRFFSELLSRLPGMPHVASAATSYATGPDHGLVTAEEGRSGNHWINLKEYEVVSPGYLRTLGIPIVQGRDFAPGDAAGDQDVAIVDEDGARRLWPGLSNPVGHMLKLGALDAPGPWVRVVGVSRITEFGPRRSIDLPPEPKIYIVRPHDTARARRIVVLGDGAGGYAGRAALILALRRELQAAAPWDGYPRVQAWLQQYEDVRAMSRFLSATLAAFGVFGLVLCAVGLYGVLAYTVARRLREFAIRIALGAPSRNVARIVLHDTAVTVLAGVGVGAFFGIAATRGMIDAFFSAKYEFAIALLGAESLLFATALVACAGPVQRAVTADPVAILRAT